MTGTGLLTGELVWTWSEESRRPAAGSGVSGRTLWRGRRGESAEADTIVKSTPVNRRPYHVETTAKVPRCSVRGGEPQKDARSLSVTSGARAMAQLGVW